MKQRYDREAEAKREVGKTDISPPLARLMTILFLALVGLVPLWESAYKLQQDSAKPRPKSLSSSVSAAAKAGAFSGLLATNERLSQGIQAYEDNIEESSRLRSIITPLSQPLFTDCFGLGNERTVIGRDNWLFFEPGVRYLTASLAQGAKTVDRAASKASELFLGPRSGPLESILDFSRQLQEQGIQLILLPAPVKAMFYPDKLSAKAAGSEFAQRGYLQSPVYEELEKDLAQHSIPLFNAATWLQAHRQELEGELFLPSDTHWSPGAAALVAQGLADFVQQQLGPGLRNKEVLQTRSQTQSNKGDIAGMLPLPAGHPLQAAQEVEILQVLQNGTELWMADPEAEILFLGDSFANIYSHPAMGWGESAGLVELFSYYADRPVDRIIQNDNGAFATRQALAQELGRGRNRLAGKKLLIWEFAVRELVTGNWKPVALRLGQARDSTFFSPEAGSSAIVQGKIQKVSSRPLPGESPYADHLISLHLVDVEVEGLAGREYSALVYAYSMIDFEPTGISTYRPGQELRLRLGNWYDVQASYGSINRSELEDYELLFEDPCWVLEVLE